MTTCLRFAPLYAPRFKKPVAFAVPSGPAMCVRIFPHFRLGCFDCKSAGAFLSRPVPLHAVQGRRHREWREGMSTARPVVAGGVVFLRHCKCAPVVPEGGPVANALENRLGPGVRCLAYPESAIRSCWEEERSSCPSPYSRHCEGLRRSVLFRSRKEKNKSQGGGLVFLATCRLACGR